MNRGGLPEPSRQRRTSPTTARKNARKICQKERHIECWKICQIECQNCMNSVARRSGWRLVTRRAFPCSCLFPCALPCQRRRLGTSGRLGAFTSRQGAKKEQGQGKEQGKLAYTYVSSSQIGQIECRAPDHSGHCWTSTKRRDEEERI